MHKRRETYFRILENKRKQAFESREALKYFLLCEELGITAEAQDLYELGQLESNLSQKDSEFLSRISHNPSNTKYEKFYRQGRYLNYRGFEADAESKRRLLVKSFPRRFGKNGKQPIEKLDDLQIGSLFSKLMEYSRKRLQQ